MTDKPLVSVIVIAFNEEKIIADCLSRVHEQTYPQKNIELILVDDNSADRTVAIAKKFGAKIVRSGYRNCERSKSIGIESAEGKYIFFLDADVFIKTSHFIEKSVEILEKDQTVVAAQSVRWFYDRKDSLMNRYCNLFGINNPLVFFLGKRGVLMATEDKWFDKNVIKQNGQYFSIVEFNSRNLPTLGSIGYMARKDAILKTTWKPYFFHLDTTLEMVKQGLNKFALTTLPVQHDFAQSFFEFHKKLYRNMYLFLRYGKFRKYDYETHSLRLMKAVLLMVTLIYPLCQSCIGFIKKKDIAWFLHPILCITVPLMYAYILMSWRIKNILVKLTKTHNAIF